MRTSSLILVGLLGAMAPTAAPPLAAQTPPPLTYTQQLTPQAVQMVQQRLRQQGAYNGEIDGVWGADSQAALERFQQTHGLQVTGQLNQATVATLGIPPDQLLSAGQPAPSAAVATPVAGSTLSPAAVQAIQTRLRDLNYYNGPTDGIWGAETQQAIERFQQGRALQVNGQLNPATVAALGLDPNILVQSR
jgi:peptidoglycan hydrolase-like protein with peptidoglycan-binding domain